MGTAPATCLPAALVRLRHAATHWKCLMIREGSVISLGMWVTISVRATWGRRRGRGCGRVGVHGPLCCHPARPATKKAEMSQATDCHPGGKSAQTSSTPAPRPQGTARCCHLPDRQTQQSFSFKRHGSRTERFASRLPGFLHKLEKTSLIFPCLPSARLFLKLFLSTGTILSAKHKVVPWC